MMNLVSCSEAAGIQKTRNSSHPRTRETRLYNNKLHAIVKPRTAWERLRLQASSLVAIVSFSLSFPLFVSAVRRRLVTRASCYDYGKTPVIYMRHAGCCQLDNPLLTRTRASHTTGPFEAWLLDDYARAIIAITSRLRRGSLFHAIQPLPPNYCNAFEEKRKVGPNEHSFSLGLGVNNWIIQRKSEIIP